VESRTDTGGFIQAADGNGQQVSIAHIEADAAPTRCADHALTKTLPGLCNEFAAEQSECRSRDMNEREHRCSGLLTAPVAVAIASIEHVSDLEADRIAGTPASQENTSHGGLHRKLFDQAKSYRSLVGLVSKRSAVAHSDVGQIEIPQRSSACYAFGRKHVGTVPRADDSQWVEGRGA